MCQSKGGHISKEMLPRNPQSPLHSLCDKYKVALDLSTQSLMDLSPLALWLSVRKLCLVINTNKLWAAHLSEKRPGYEQNLSGNYNEQIGFRRRAI
jgi:hypothetical protein